MSALAGCRERWEIARMRPDEFEVICHRWDASDTRYASVYGPFAHQADAMEFVASNLFCRFGLRTGEPMEWNANGRDSWLAYVGDWAD